MCTGSTRGKGGAEVTKNKKFPPTAGTTVDRTWGNGVCKQVKGDFLNFYNIKLNFKKLGGIQDANLI